MMPGWLQQLTRDLLPLSVTVAVVSGLVLALTLPFTKGSRTNLVVLVVGLAVLGAVAGYAGGTSRVGVVGDIIPAALALAGGVSVYLFGVDPSKGVIASICAVAFSLALGLGYAAGAGDRRAPETYSAWTEACRNAFMSPDILASDAASKRLVAYFGETCSAVLGNDIARLGEPETLRERASREAGRLKSAFGQTVQSSQPTTQP